MMRVICRSPTQITLLVEKDEKKDEPWMRLASERLGRAWSTVQRPQLHVPGGNLMAVGRGGPSVHHRDNWHHSSSAWAPLWKYYWQYHSQWLFGNKAIFRRIWQSWLREPSDLRCLVNTARVETTLTHSTTHEALTSLNIVSIHIMCCHIVFTEGNWSLVTFDYLEMTSFWWAPLSWECACL